MEYLFVSDIGNTTITFGVFKDDKLIAKTSILTYESQIDSMKEAINKMISDNHLEDAWFSGGLISSVVPNLSRLVQIAIEASIHVLLPIMGKRYSTLVKMNVDDPSEVGGDLLADVSYVIEDFKGPSLIVDLGTISKILLTDENKAFVATNFFPGVKLCAKMMTEKTALLPEAVLKEKPNSYMGKNTLDAMKGGLYYSTLHMIEGYEKTLKEKYNNINLILTGGYASVFKEDLKDFICDEDVTLKGIKTLYRLGVKNGF